MKCISYKVDIIVKGILLRIFSFKTSNDQTFYLISEVEKFKIFNVHNICENINLNFIL